MPRRQPTKKSTAGSSPDLANLTNASRSDLQAGWRASTGQHPPARISTDLLRRALAHRLQLAAIGGSRRNVERRLRASTTAQRARRRTLPIGTRLVREWGGTTHIVDVTTTGLHWAGRTCSSLTEIARTITGTHWSGPRFFGLSGAAKASEPP